MWQPFVAGLFGTILGAVISVGAVLLFLEALAAVAEEQELHRQRDANLFDL